MGNYGMEQVSVDHINGQVHGLLPSTQNIIG